MSVAFSDDDDVPPLEDMSAVLKRPAKQAAQPERLAEAKLQPEPSVSKQAAAPQPAPTEKAPPKAPAVKKGFFNTAPKNANTSKASSEPAPRPVEYVKPADPDPKAHLKLPGVQEAMAAAARLEQGGPNSWVTPELLKALMQQPDLMQAFANPKFQEAIQLMQKDPAEAKRRYAADAQVTSWLTRFCSLMGTHFEVLTKKQEEEAKQTAPNPQQQGSGASSSSAGAVLLPPAKPVRTGPLIEDITDMPEDAKTKPKPKAKANTAAAPSYPGTAPPQVNPNLDPRAQELLSDPGVRSVVELLRRGAPIDFRELMARAPAVAQKCHILMQMGLLGTSNAPPPK